MASKVSCYLRTLRREWGLTQKELATLVHCRRARVSSVERGLIPPNGAELVAYALLFGVAPQAIFPDYTESIEDAVMRGAGRLDRQLADNESPAAIRKREFLEQLGRRIAPLEAFHTNPS